MEGISVETNEYLTLGCSCMCILQFGQAPIHSLNQTSSGFNSASSSSTASEEENFGRNDGGQNSRRTPPRVHYEEEQARVLAASLRHAMRLGWTEAAMIAGAREVGVSPSIVGAFPRKEAALVEYFMDECLQRLIDIIDSDESLKQLLPSERIAKLVRARLELQVPYISKWPQALSIQAQPLNFPTSFKQRAMLVDEICHGAGDEGSDIDWYVKRTVLGGVYSATEIYMLTDSSPDFRDTWGFLNARVRDASDLKRSLQEVKYFGRGSWSRDGKLFPRICKESLLSLLEFNIFKHECRRNCLFTTVLTEAEFTLFIFLLFHFVGFVYCITLTDSFNNHSRVCCEVLRPLLSPLV